MGGQVGPGPDVTRSATVWTSIDGVAWERTGLEPRAGVHAITGGAGRVVAVGHRMTGADDSDAAAWSSTGDGPWAPMSDPGNDLGGPGSQGTYGVSASSAGHVELVGWSDDRARLWASGPDGAGWDAHRFGPTMGAGTTWNGRAAALMRSDGNDSMELLLGPP